jgi:hypothetical protein
VQLSFVQRDASEAIDIQAGWTERARGGCTALEAGIDRERREQPCPLALVIVIILRALHSPLSQLKLGVPRQAPERPLGYL